MNNTMKKNSALMYRIGFVLNIIILVLASLAIVHSILFIIFANEIFNYFKNSLPVTFEAKTLSLFGAIGCTIYGYLLILCIVLLVLSSKAIKSLESDDTNTSPHVLMIVFGVFAIAGLFGIFYLLGGIFGLIENNNLQQQKILAQAQAQQNEE